MRVLIAIEERFFKTVDGKIVSSNTIFDYEFWKRYLQVFDEVLVYARVKETTEEYANKPVANGPGVSFFPVPYFIGPWEFFKAYRKTNTVAEQAVKQADAFILRVPGTMGTMILRQLMSKKAAYGLEVVGDPYDVFSPGAVKHFLRPFFRWWFSRQLRRRCSEASAVAYVTKEILQRRYPPAPKAFTTYYSSIDLPNEALISMPKSYKSVSEREHSLTLITVAPDVLIDAVAICAKDNLDLRLVFVGDGKHRKELEERAQTTGLGNRACFLGQLPAGDAVRDQLDRADLFVLPSRQEGLPRSMIEAMARGLPCIGSTAGGIPELLPPEDLVPPGNVVALASKIREMVSEPERMEQVSARNLKKAKEYREEILIERRIIFYRYVRGITEKS